MFGVVLTSKHSAVCDQHLAIFLVISEGGYSFHLPWQYSRGVAISRHSLF